jgi:HlyD family secretion protein
MRYIKYLFILFITAFIGYIVWEKFFKRGCHKPSYRDKKIIVSNVTVGEFIEWIIQTGRYDTSRSVAVVPVDQLYLDRIVAGLNGKTIFNGTEYSMLVSHVDSTIIDGRFTADVKFDDELSHKLLHSQSIRVRIFLDDAISALLLPVGGFYKDTGGEWVVVLEDDGAIVRRSIKLGKKNTEYFEVLEGLKEGDRVITSSYEDLIDDDDVDVEAVQEEIEKLAKGS